MSSEEDASVALQVSNALTHALLQFRMNSLPQEVRNNLYSFRPLAIRPWPGSLRYILASEDQIRPRLMIVGVGKKKEHENKQKISKTNQVQENSENKTRNSKSSKCDCIALYCITHFLTKVLPSHFSTSWQVSLVCLPHEVKT